MRMFAVLTKSCNFEEIDSCWWRENFDGLSFFCFFNQQIILEAHIVTHNAQQTSEQTTHRSTKLAT